ncbi:hypothetical protein WN71_002550 [Streptomyces mangrovisoli]|uniref:Uncharacterized protein n=1 Tax=Streptomyces mangrovisoli TaxID=1428628 RepID=A0A1J4P3Z9_9ACTN|nr:hypothetical protein WN71_002550 [Streptomyces mangrovisoli]
MRAEGLRGLGPWAGAAVLVAVAVGMGTGLDRWQGDWAETGRRLHAAACLLGAPLAVAAGCRQGGRERRRGTGELLRTAVRPPLARFLVSGLPVALWAVAGYLVAAVAALLATWPYAQGDRPYPASLPADAVLIAAAALTGQVLGRRVAWWPVAPLAGLAAYAASAAVAYQDPGALGRLAPSADGAYGTVPLWWQPVAMSVWTGSLALTAVLACTVRRRVLAFAPLAAAAVAGVLLVQAGDRLWHERPLAHRQVCDTSTTPRICVDARYAGLLPQVVRALSGVTDRLAGVRGLPVRFEDRPGRPRRDEVELPMLTPVGRTVVRGRLTDPRQYAFEAGAALTGRQDCARTDPRVSAVDDAVQHYLAPNPAEASFDRAAARGDADDRAALASRRAARARLAAMGATERRQWLSAYFATARGCDPGEVPSL